MPQPEDYTIIGIYDDSDQRFMTCARGITPDDAVEAARNTIEDEYSRDHMRPLAVFRGNLLDREVEFTDHTEH